MSKPIDFDGCLFNAESDAAATMMTINDRGNANGQAMVGARYEGDFHNTNPIDLTPNMFTDQNF